MIRVTSLAATLLGLTLVAPAVPAQVAKLHPVDEAAEDPSFFTFRSRLAVAVAERDTAFVYGILSPRISNSFGGDSGIGEFREIWQPAEAQSRLWPTLARILSSGGRFSRSLDEGLAPFFTAPYTFAAFPDDRNAFEYAAVVGENVRVRSAPDVESEIIAHLLYDIVRVITFLAREGLNRPPEGWERVELTDGKVGYVAAQFIASPLDFRAGFEKRQGRWVMTYLVAGD